MKLILFCLLHVVSGHVADEYFNKLGCDIKIVDYPPRGFHEYNEPFIWKRGTEHLQEIKAALNTTFLKDFHGSVGVGVDYPGAEVPPTENWEIITLYSYITDYIEKLEKLSFEEALQSDLKNIYLWGPTDNLEKHGVFTDDHYKTKFVPENVYFSYECPWKVSEKDQIIYGLGGKHTGLAFHEHTWVSNEIIYGKKLWLLYPKGTRIDTQKYTSIDMINTMITEYLDDDTFMKPYMCILEEGDLLNIPNGWVHMSYNLETTAMVGCVYE